MGGCDVQAVLVHQLSKQATQNPFRKNRGRVVRTAFHPSKPFFFVATQNHVRIYNLAKQALAKKLLAGSGVACLAVHPSGDHIIVGSEVPPPPSSTLTMSKVLCHCLDITVCWALTLMVTVRHLISSLFAPAGQAAGVV